jgi:dihydrofolate synthase/folylpolyglutamate synthase
MEVVESIAERKGSPVYRWNRDFSAPCDEGGKLNYHGRRWHLQGIEVGLHGTHQRRNAAVAIAAMELAQDRLCIEENALRRGLKDVVWPGRLEVFPRKPMIILDGAHNVEGVQTLVSELPAIVGQQKVRLLFGSMGDKDWRTMLCLLCKVSSEVVLTEVPRPHSAPPAALRTALPAGVAAEVITDPVEALAHAVNDAKKTDVPILVAGSLYLIGLVRDRLL